MIIEINVLFLIKKYNEYSVSLRVAVGVDNGKNGSLSDKEIL